MRKAILLLAVVSLAFVGLAAPAGADSELRPFTGRASGAITVMPDSACSALGLRTDSDAVGVAAHMGTVVMASEHCTPAGPDITGGEMVLVAANGDQVFIEYSGTASPPGAGPYVVAEVVFEIVGGSGRFDGATGGGEMTAVIEFLGMGVPTWPGVWVWEGTIGY